MISLRDVLRGATTRYLPSCLVGLVALLALLRLILGGPMNVGWTNILPQMVVLAAGYVTTLILMRYRLRADADVAGTRSIVAGLVTPAALLCSLIFIRPTSAISFSALSLVLGGTMALLMFFPWLKAHAVPALTDEEARSLLSEGAVDWDSAMAAQPEDISSQQYGTPAATQNPPPVATPNSPTPG